MKLSVATTKFNRLHPSTSNQISKVAPQSLDDSSDGQVPRCPISLTVTIESTPSDGRLSDARKMAVASATSSTRVEPISTCPLRRFQHGGMGVPMMTSPEISSSSTNSVASLTAKVGSTTTSAEITVSSSPPPPSFSSSTTSVALLMAIVTSETTSVDSAGMHSETSTSVCESICGMIS